NSVSLIAISRLTYLGVLGSLHNLWYYDTLMANMRAAITAGTFFTFRHSFYLARGLDPPPLPEVASCAG
ncbi:hypothetical protein FGX56_01255, partial [Xylella fastidiosa subsp. multiplex]|nr:hypothetical protein [Xylella fastidiosa subsp. multiplex]